MRSLNFTKAYTKFSVALIAVALIAQIINPSVLFAQSAQTSFTTSLTVTSGATPPSIPANLFATAISSSQINLTWNASVSGGIFTVAGYRIFRDGSFLATTTAVTYSDTGLTPITTYAYTVEAFDTAFQLSGQSATSSATTLSPNVVINPGSSGNSELQIKNILINPATNQATVTFQTTVPAQTQTAWGLTVNAQDGSQQSLSYDYNHQVVISNLQSSTVYFLKLTATNSQGYSVIATSTFTTLAPVIGPLANPSNFKVVPEDTHLHLSWNNPNDPRFDSVRIIRSETFFPKDQFDGVPVYEGSGTSVNDMNVVADKTYYYAIFAKSTTGEFSSGALAQGYLPKPGEVLVATSSDPFAHIPQSKIVDPRIAALTLMDFDFIQDGRELTKLPNLRVPINGSENLTIRLKYEKVPEILKTIAVTLSDPTDSTKVFPFLLRVNADKSAYEATIAPLGRSGNYGMSIVVLDYENQGLKRIDGSLAALAFTGFSNIGNGFNMFMAILLALIILIIMIIVYVISHRKGRKQQVMTTPRPVFTTK